MEKKLKQLRNEIFKVMTNETLRKINPSACEELEDALTSVDWMIIDVKEAKKEIESVCANFVCASNMMVNVFNKYGSSSVDEEIADKIKSISTRVEKFLKDKK